MAVYNVNGESVSQSYDLVGNRALTGYKIDGTPIVLAEPILLTDVPEYFRTDITNALNYINGLSNDYVNYIVVTDSHYELEAQARHTPVLLNYLYQEGRFDKLIHLGDMVDGGGFNGLGWQRMVEDDWWHFVGSWLFAQGNHDSAWNTSLAELASCFETRENIRYTINSEHNLFYYDNPDYQLRIIGSHHQGFKGDTDTLNSYVRAARNKGYKWIFIGHYRIDDTGDWILNAVDTYGGFICCLSGHRHTDTFRTVATPNSNSALDINLEADIQGGVAGKGVDTEQCITLVSINPTTGNVKLYRIGLSRVYSGHQWEFTAS